MMMTCLPVNIICILIFHFLQGCIVGPFLNVYMFTSISIWTVRFDKVFSLLGEPRWVALNNLSAYKWRVCYFRFSLYYYIAHEPHRFIPESSNRFSDTTASEKRFRTKTRQPRGNQYSTSFHWSYFIFGNELILELFWNRISSLFPNILLITHMIIIDSVNSCANTGSTDRRCRRRRGRRGPPSGGRRPATAARRPRRARARWRGAPAGSPPPPASTCSTAPISRPTWHATRLCQRHSTAHCWQWSSPSNDLLTYHTTLTERIGTGLA